MTSNLPPEDQTLLSLRIDQGLSWDEIADVLSSVEGGRAEAKTIAKRYERLKMRLAALLRDDD